MSVAGYTKEDNELQSLTSAGIAVITGEDQGTIASNPVLKEYPNNNSPSPLMADKSDDEDSEHGDMYGQQTKGRVSPSPYTANTERARQFNAYVRTLIEDKLDILIPISHQPRELVHQIITESNERYPEFSSSVRKRIRTYLKSYRRSRRVKDMQAAAALANTYHPSNGLSSNKERPHHEESVNVSAIALPSNMQQQQLNTSAIVTIGTPRSNSVNDEEPEAKKRRIVNPLPNPQPPALLNSAVIPAVTSAAANLASGGGQGLSLTEIATLKQLIQGYRESANFLNRAANQLEELIGKDNSVNV